MSARDSVLSSLRAVEQSILTLTDKDDLKAIASRISYARSLCKVRSKLLASLILPKSRIPHQYYEFLFGSKHTNPVSRHERRIEDRLYRERKPKLLQLDPVASRFCGITYTLRELRNLDESDFNCLCGTIEDFVTKHKAWTSLAYDDLSQSGSLSYFQSSDYGEYCRAYQEIVAGRALTGTEPHVQDEEVKALAATHIAVLHALCNALGPKYRVYPMMPMSHLQNVPNQIYNGIKSSDLFAAETEKGQDYTGTAPIWLSREASDGYALFRLGYQGIFDLAVDWGSKSADVQFRDNHPS